LPRGAQFGRRWRLLLAVEHHLALGLRIADCILELGHDRLAAVDRVERTAATCDRNSRSIELRASETSARISPCAAS
jgi:hypothetical protein